MWQVSARGRTETWGGAEGRETPQIEPEAAEGGRPAPRYIGATEQGLIGAYSAAVSLKYWCPGYLAEGRRVSLPDPSHRPLRLAVVVKLA